MPLATPDWLARRGGSLKQEPTGKWTVLLDRQPQYRLELIPVRGQLGCAVVQTVNGRRLDRGGAHATADEALRGGLDDLRAALGW
jgi:hypothetical protein